jgi:hypothetical protein
MNPPQNTHYKTKVNHTNWLQAVCKAFKLQYILNESKTQQSLMTGLSSFPTVATQACACSRQTTKKMRHKLFNKCKPNWIVVLN